MASVIGWDIGGAHLKAVRVEGERVVAALQMATPLWRGLECLDAAFLDLSRQLGPSDRHVATMTGELCDAFASRRDGVVGLAGIAARHLGPGSPLLYAGPAGFVPLEAASEHAALIASANWRASAALVGAKLSDALLMDIGSTTTDLIPIVAGKPAAIGYSDAERLAAGELVYTGMARSFVMAMATRAPFAGQWTPLMNEYFASSADVHRILDALPEGADKMASADGREKTAAASRARLARMIGREADGSDDAGWERLAAWFAEAQLRDIVDAAMLRLSRGDVGRKAPVVIAGIGDKVAAEAARRLGRFCVNFTSLIDVSAEAAQGACQCAPAAALALLAARAGGLIVDP